LIKFKKPGKSPGKSINMKKQTSKKARSKTPLAKSQKLNDMIFAGHH